jgi:hypothetical protein
VKIAKEERKEERRIAIEKRRGKQNKNLHFYANIGLIIFISIAIGLLFWFISDIPIQSKPIELIK